MSEREIRLDAETVAIEVLDHIDLVTALARKTPKELVDLALNHLSLYVTDPTYEQIIEELCTRVHPGWSHDDE